MNVLYTMDGCINCYKAKKHLDSYNISYKEINILEQQEAANTLINLIGEVYTPVYVTTNNKILKGKNILHHQKEDLRA
ncbi:glutaredoxin family protein [Pontibacillus salicampi]|uniref:Glutaredoxin family protein n=1 Tax=Pontibacillus salicampi TaxID=1449801 RepID=A0ABV6LMX8_9BACI